MRDAFDSDVLPFEIVSLFNHDLIDRWHWLMVLRSSPKLMRAHLWFLRNYKYSPVQDASYALQARTPIHDKHQADKWEALMADPSFEILRLSVTDNLSEVQAIFHLTWVFYNTYMNPSANSGMGDKFMQNLENLIAQELADLEEDFTKNPGNESDNNSPINALVGTKDGFKQGSQQTVKMLLVIFEEDLENLRLIGGLFASPTGSNTREVNRIIEDFTQSMGLRNLSKILGYAKQSMLESYIKTKIPNNAAQVISQGKFGSNTRTLDKYLFVSGNPIGINKNEEGRMINKFVNEGQGKKRGGLYILTDQSDSMSGETNRITPTASFTMTHPLSASNRQTKDHQAFSFEVSIAALLAQSGRNCVGVGWNASETIKFDYGSKDMDAFRKYANTFLGGGTKISHVFNKILPDIEPNADLFILSDGQIDDDPLHDPTARNLIEKFRAKGGKIWLMYIGHQGANVTWADITLTAEDLVKSDALKPIFTMLGQDPSSKGREAI